MGLILFPLYICYHFLIHKNLCLRNEVTKTLFVKKQHKMIKELIQQQTEKYYEKLQKTIEKQKE